MIFFLLFKCVWNMWSYKWVSHKNYFSHLFYKLCITNQKAALKIECVWWKRQICNFFNYFIDIWSKLWKKRYGKNFASSNYILQLWFFQQSFLKRPLNQNCKVPLPNKVNMTIQFPEVWQVKNYIIMLPTVFRDINKCTNSINFLLNLLFNLATSGCQFQFKVNDFLQIFFFTLQLLFSQCNS